MDERFSVSSTDTIAETIDGEVILIHLGTGAYYSLRGVGADIWAAIERGASRGEMLDMLEARYDAPRDELDLHLARHLEELQTEGLAGPEAAAERHLVVVAEPVSSRMPFSPPLLEKHTDMQDLILIDPVHEVEARGWPHTAEASGLG